MDRTTAKTLRTEIEEAIAKIAKKHKLNLELGSGTFTTSDFAVRVKLVGANAPAKITLPTRKAPPMVGLMIEQAAKGLGLPVDVVGQKFRHKTKTFTVTALTPSRPKNCVSLVDQNGKGFKCSADMLKRMMGK